MLGNKRYVGLIQPPTSHLTSVNFIVNHKSCGFQKYGPTLKDAAAGMESHLKYTEVTKQRYPPEGSTNGVWEDIFRSKQIKQSPSP